MSQKWWTDELVLRARVDERRESVHNTAGPLLDEGLEAWLAGQKRDLSLLKAASGEVEQKRMEGRAFVKKQMAWPDWAAPLDAVVRSREEFADYIKEEVVFTGAAPLRVPGIVLIPRKGDGPFPAVAALHDMGGMRVYGKEKLLAFAGESAALTQHREDCYDGVSIMAELAKRGYLVIAIDAINFGERTMGAAEDPEGFGAMRDKLSVDEARALTMRIGGEQEVLLVRHILSVGRTWPGLMTVDDVRTVDYLCSRGDVDKARIGCMGLSVGGYRANHLAAVDERVRAAVSVCWSSTLDGVVGYNVDGAIGWFMLAPGLFERMDICDVQALASPRAFMAISGWDDQLMQPYGMARGHLHLRRCFEHAGCPEQLGSMIYDCPHEFNAQMQGDAFEWLGEKL